MRSALGWAFTTWLTLTALQALATRTAPGRVASAFRDVDSILERILDPSVPAIPDRRAGAAGSSSSSETTSTRTGYSDRARQLAESRRAGGAALAGGAAGAAAGAAL